MDRINEVIAYIQGLELSKIVDLIIAIAVIILFLVISPVIGYGVLRIFYKKEDKDEIQKSPIYKTIRVFINLSGIYLATKIAVFSKQQDTIFDKCMKIVVIWSIVNIIAGVSELNQKIIERLEKEKKYDISKNDKFTVIIVGKIVKYILYILASYLTLKELGYDIEGLATGLGIGGAVLVLAAQNLVKQFLSGFAIISDKPFVIGDYIEIVKGGNTIAGNVVGITWRSTRLETNKDTIISVDNSEIISSSVVNWGKIKKRVYSSDIHLSLETDEQVVEKVISRIKFILRNDIKIIEKTIRVNLVGIDGDSLTISIYLETTITNYNKYLEFCSKLNLTILNIIESQGISLAYPGRNIYIKESERKLPLKKTVKHVVKQKEKKTSKPVKIIK